MDSAISFATGQHATLAHASPKRSHAPLEYRVVWALVFGASLIGGVLVRGAIRPLAALLNAVTGDAIPAAGVRRRDATLIGEARAAADAAAPFVFQVS